MCWTGLGISAWAQPSAVVRLDASATQRQSYPPALSVAAGLSAALTVQEVALLPRERFVAFDPNVTHPISIDSPLWLRMQIDAGQAIKSNWQLEMPSVIVDRYEVYQRDASGNWQMAQAGDRVPHRTWPLPSLRPRFPLHTTWPGVQDIYIRVVHQLPSTLEPVLVDAQTATERDAGTMMSTGVLVGLMLALLLICLQMVLSYRDWTYLWYAAYLLFIMLSSLAYVGVGQKFLWPTASKFSSDVMVYFVLAAFCFNLLFVNAMFGKWLGKTYRRVTYLLMAACVVYMGVNYYMDRYAPTIVYFLAITTSSCAFILFTAVQAWRKGVPYSGYWLLVYIPYLISIVLVLAQAVGRLNLPWLPVDTPMLTAMVEAVAMMFCLNAYSRER
ncbi:MAG: 7TM diverse intracellular signaling domain-containing protein, partial [Brachymonas sp.]